MAYEIGVAEMEPLLLGGAFFGSGGGGTVESARHLAAHWKIGDYYPVDRVNVVSVEQAVRGDSVMVAYMGAPVAIDGALYPLGPVEAARQVMVRLAEQGRTLAYVVAPESGALGFVVACLVAARLGLEVIDADGAGRAVPSLPMLTYAAAGISPRPTFLVSQDLLSVELDVTPRQAGDGSRGHQQDIAAVVEQMTRPIVAAPQFGQFGGLAMWVMAPEQLPAALPIRNTLSNALTLGRALVAGTLSTASDAIEFLASKFGLAASAVSPSCELQAVSTSTSGGFDLGKVTLQAGDHTYTVLFQNESLMVWDNTRPQPVVMAPDSIAYFIDGTGQQVFSNGDLLMPDGSLNPLVRNRTVTLLAWEAHASLQKPGGLILESFQQLLADLGYLGPYVPLGSGTRQSGEALQ